MTEAAVDDGRLVAGRYRLVEEIGRGGMGTVWRSYDELLGRQVAVKRLHVSPQLEPDELARRNERTRREAQSAARINHPNVVSVHDVVDDAGLPCIVMEYVPSVTLGDLIKEATLSDGAVPLGEVARIGRGMVAALRAAHSAGVLHRDVKPGNVLLGEDGRVVLTDFGIAVATGTSTLTKTGELIGSIDYLAPERVRGGTPGPASDLWALGATLYQALEGRPPFRKLTAVETAYSIAVDPLEPPRNAGALTGLIEALLAKDPADRPSAQAVEQALRAPAAHTDTTAWLSGASAHGAAGDSTATTTAGTTPPAHGDHTNTPAPTPAPTPPSATGSYHLAPPATNGTNDTTTTGNTSGNTAPTGGFTPATGPTAPVNHPATAPATTPPPSEKQPGKRGRTILLTAVSLVAAVVLAGSTLYALGYWPDGDAQASDSRTPQPENPSPTPSKPRAKPTPRPVPAGYHRVTDPAAGVDFPLPNGWTRQKQANGSVYLNPNQLVGLRIESLDFAGANPLQRWKDNERAALNEGKFPGYQQLRMQETRFRDRPAALWEWKWSGSRREFRAIDLGFGRPGEKEYAIYLSAPATEWDRYKKVFDDVLAGLRLPEDREQAGQDEQAKRDDQ
ncbi:serine/threonine-protein kinase [Streptomyces rimosus]|uniref:serine/threonine-protein kinase n=1 Tax=Streptomyces rimosus TaxID=1927 RepID=UPI000518AF91|nr:serine/threonine-protein kinase [Streptomyces rimosus]